MHCDCIRIWSYARITQRLGPRGTITGRPEYLGEILTGKLEAPNLCFGRGQWKPVMDDEGLNISVISKYSVSLHMNSFKSTCDSFSFIPSHHDIFGITSSWKERGICWLQSKLTISCTAAAFMYSLMACAIKPKSPLFVLQAGSLNFTAADLSVK